MILGKDLGYSS